MRPIPGETQRMQRSYAWVRAGCDRLNEAGSLGFDAIGPPKERRRASYLISGAVGQEILAVGKWTPGWAGERIFVESGCLAKRHASDRLIPLHAAKIRRIIAKQCDCLA